MAGDSGHKQFLHTLAYSLRSRQKTNNNDSKSISLSRFPEGPATLRHKVRVFIVMSPFRSHSLWHTSVYGSGGSVCGVCSECSECAVCVCDLHCPLFCFSWFRSFSFGVGKHNAHLRLRPSDTLTCHAPIFIHLHSQRPSFPFPFTFSLLLVPSYIFPHAQGKNIYSGNQ